MEPQTPHMLQKNSFEALFMEPIPEKPGMRLAESMADHFKSMITNGSLKAGDKLPTEHQLCDYYSVSRSTLRESMQILRAHGYLDVSPGRGSFIKSVQPISTSGQSSVSATVSSDRDYEQILRVVKGLTYTAFAPFKSSAKQLLAFIKHYEIQLTDTPEEIADKEYGWRIALAKESGNFVLASMMEQIFTQMRPYCLKRLAVEEHRMQALTKQQVVISYLERGDVAAVERCFSL